MSPAWPTWKRVSARRGSKLLMPSRIAEARLLAYDDLLAAYSDPAISAKRNALRTELTKTVAASPETQRAKEIESPIPTLSATTDWTKLLAACRSATATPAIVACRAEYVAELRHGQSVGDLAAERKALDSTSGPYGAVARTVGNWPATKCRPRRGWSKPTRRTAKRRPAHFRADRTRQSPARRSTPPTLRIRPFSPPPIECVRCLAEELPTELTATLDLARLAAATPATAGQRADAGRQIGRHGSHQPRADAGQCGFTQGARVLADAPGRRPLRRCRRRGASNSAARRRPPVPRRAGQLAFELYGGPPNSTTGRLCP